MCYDKDMERVKEMLEELKAKGWGDGAIAEALGVNLVTIWRWRTGRTRPHPEWLYREELERLLRLPRPPGRRKTALASTDQGGEKASPNATSERQP